MAESGQDLGAAVRAHLARVFPERGISQARFAARELVVNLPELAVFEVAPPAAEAGAPWLYVTAGASAETMDDGYGLEFVLCAAAAEALAAKLVAMVANLHADPRYPLSLGQVVEIGHPWLPGASADHLIVALPGIFDPELEWLSDRAHTIRFIWLVPITRGEAGFAKQHGLDALQSRLGAAQADLTSVTRPSVV
ncbi:MAG TPA: suppressor of fused domain protein [Myxococcota bacterium]|nr:suppressor of fused domain protein [Myxococcota bacterium]